MIKVSQKVYYSLGYSSSSDSIVEIYESNKPKIDSKRLFPGFRLLVFLCIASMYLSLEAFGMLGGMHVIQYVELVDSGRSSIRRSMFTRTEN